MTRRTTILVLACLVGTTGCRRHRHGWPWQVRRQAHAAVAPVRPVVTCMVYRACGCARGCAGVSAVAEDLQVGTTLPIVAGMACGTTVRVERAVGADGRLTRVLGATGECNERCGMAALEPVNAAACLGACEACPSGGVP